MRLFECLELISDPRKPRGVRHPFPAILRLVMLGFVCRLVAREHITSYFSPIWSEISPALGFDSYRHKIPDATTIRRALAGLKVEQLQEASERGFLIFWKTRLSQLRLTAMR